MKTYLAFVLLFQLSTQAPLVADTPTFTQLEPKNYIGTHGNDINLGPTDIDVQTKDDFIITLGTQKTSQVAAVLGGEDCKKTTSESCQKTLKSALGIGPGNDGLQKRVVGVDDAAIAAVFTWIVYSVGEVVRYMWNDDYSKHFSGQAQFKIPKEQKEEIQKWDTDGDEFTFKPYKGDPITVKLDSPPKEKPDDAPTITKEENGDLTITFVGHGSDLENIISKVLCAREGKRSLDKRAARTCLISIARALLQQFQVGAALDGVYYLDPLKEFPKPKNELLIEAIANEEEFLEKERYWFGAEEVKQRQKKYAALSSWMAFGYTVGHISVQGDKFTYSKSFLDKQEEEEEEEKQTCAKDPTFCSNCGGNAIANNWDTLLGSCKGTDNGALKGCACFMGLPEIRHTRKFSDIKAAYEQILALRNHEKKDEKKDDDISPSCYKTAENEVVIYTNDSEGDKARDQFCKEQNGKEISESDAVQDHFTDTHEYIKGEKAKFQFNAYAGKNCGTKKIVEKDCKDAMNIIMKKCPTKDHDDRTLGGEVTIGCQRYMFVPNRYIPDIGVI